jgi:hypothetical protein
MTWIIHQLWEYKAEEKLYLGVRKQRVDITAILLFYSYLTLFISGGHLWGSSSPGAQLKGTVMLYTDWRGNLLQLDSKPSQTWPRVVSSHRPFLTNILPHRHSQWLSQASRPVSSCFPYDTEEGSRFPRNVGELPYLWPSHPKILNYRRIPSGRLAISAWFGLLSWRPLMF